MNRFENQSNSPSQTQDNNSATTTTTTTRIMLPTNLVSHSPGFIVGWNSGAVSYVCASVISDIDLISLEQTLSRMKEALRRLNSDVVNDDREVTQLVDALSSIAESDSKDAHLLESISMRLIDSVILDNDVDDLQRQRTHRCEQLRRLADVFERTSYPTILGTWGVVSDLDGSVALKVQKSDFWISLRSSPATNIDANAFCYGYSLISSMQIVLFDVLSGDQYYTQVREVSLYCVNICM
jgi:hypothetical protein